MGIRVEGIREINAGRENGRGIWSDKLFGFNRLGGVNGV